ncbi:membrane protein [Staphylococcus kloosii]|jgi:uncharacterized membrane protein|nr:membrane protein [Staphylococcus kloosii]
MSQSFFVGDYFLHSIFFENQFIFYLIILAVFHRLKYCGMVFKSVYIKGGINMEWLKLIGIVIIIVGFLLKIDTIAVVLIAAIVTGLVSGMDFTDILSTLGKAFTDNRLVTLFLLTLPMVGLIERFGLKQQASKLIGKIDKVTSGRLMTVYLGVRELAGLASIRIGGHPQFVRPLINPMVQGALRTRFKLNSKQVEDKDVELIKAQTSAMENYGNFFGQNLFVGGAGILLMVGTFKSLKINVDAVDLALASVPIALITFVIVWLNNMRLDRYFQRKYEQQEVTKDE